MKYSCDLCFYYTHNKSGYTSHISSMKHKKAVELRKYFMSKAYRCDTCMYSTNSLHQWISHTKSMYHINGGNRY